MLRTPPYDLTSYPRGYKMSTMKSLYSNKNISLRKTIATICLFSILTIVFLCSFTGIMPFSQESHAMSTMPSDNNAPIDHPSHFTELTSFTTQNTSSSSVLYLFLLIISLVLFSFRGKPFLHFPTLLSASNFFIRKRSEILHIARQSFYSWYSLFERAPNTVRAA